MGYETNVNIYKVCKLIDQYNYRLFNRQNNDAWWAKKPEVVIKYRTRPARNPDLFWHERGRHSGWCVDVEDLVEVMLRRHCENVGISLAQHDPR